MDLWKNYNESMQNLGNTFDTLYAQRRQEKLDAQNAQALQQAYDIKALALDKAKRDAAYEQGLQSYVKENMVPVTTANPAYAQWQAFQVGPPVVPMESYAGLQAAVDANPGMAKLSGSDKRLAEMKAEPTYNYNQAQYPNADVQAPPQTVTKTKPYAQLAMEYAQSNGNVDAMKALEAGAMERALNLSKITGNGKVGVDAYNDLMGTNLQYLKENNEFIHVKQGENILKVNKDTGAIEVVAQGQEKDDNKETWGAPTTMKLGGKTALVQQSSHGQIRPVLQDAQRLNLTVNASTPDAVQADAQAVIEGRLAPSGISKRNGHDVKVRQAVSAMNPNFNFSEADANAGFIKNAAQNRQYVNLEAVKTPIRELGELGAKLNNGNLVPANKWRQTITSNTGNPDIIAYRAKRNSVIQELANAMRGQGISEGSIQLEMQNFSDAYSPEQLKAAVDNTLQVIEAKQKAIRTLPFQGNLQKGGNNTGGTQIGEFYVVPKR